MTIDSQNWHTSNLSSGYSSERAGCTAAQIIEESIGYGLDFDDLRLKQRLREFDGAGQLEKLADIVELFPSADYEQRVIICALAVLLDRVPSEEVIPCLPHLAVVLRIAFDVAAEYVGGSITYIVPTTGRLVADVITYDGFDKLIDEFTEDKLSALFKVILLKVDDSSGLTEERHKIIAKASVHANIVTELDIEALRLSSVGLLFRQKYIDSVLPYPTSPMNNRYFLPDRIIDQLASIHKEKRHHEVLNLNKYLMDDHPLAEIEEVFSYRNLLVEVDPMSYSDIFNSLHMTSLLPPSVNYSHADDEVRVKCEALITMFAALFQRKALNIPEVEYIHARMNAKRSGAFVLSDDRRVSFLMENPERVHEVVTVLAQRRSLDWDALVIALRTTSALSEGAL